MRTLLCLLPLALGCTAGGDDDPGARFGGKADGDTPPFKAHLAMDRDQDLPIAFAADGGDAVDLVYASFELSGSASVAFRTAHHAGADDIDTVLYIYEPGPDDWGSWIARDDDGGGGQYSKVTADLEAGSYTLLLRRRDGSGVPVVDLRTACSGTGCAPVVDQTCADPRYGDGTCQTDLPCDVPDIDCFVTFPDDDAANAWFTQVEAGMAQQQGRAPRAIVAHDDPRYMQARALADRGWDAFRTVRPVGKLADARPAVVVLEDPNVNAFVAPFDDMAKQGAFSIQVQTGLLAVDAPDDGRLGVMMHELQHVVGLHVIAGVGDRIRHFYVAPAGSELDPQDQPDDPAARAAWMTWTGYAHDIGAYTDDVLGGFPIAGSQLDQLMTLALQVGAQTNPGACTTAQGAIGNVRGEFRTSLLDDSLISTPSLASDIDGSFDQLRACLAGFSGGFVELVAQATGQSVDQVTAGMTADDLAVVSGKTPVDALVALGLDRRARMLATEQSFAEQLGRPWSALRFYSREEAADDTSIPVLRAAMLDPAGLAHFFLPFLGDVRMTCEGDIASTSVPYGVRLDDDHHGTCYRVEHIEQRATTGDLAAARTLPRPALPVPARSHWGLPRRWSDVIVY